MIAWFRSAANRIIGSRFVMADTSGSALMEYALLVPIYLGLMVAILQTGLIYIAQQGLETATQNAGRLIMTGQAQKAGYSASQFKTAACNSLPPFLSCSNLYIDVQTVGSYSSASLTPPTITYASGNVTNTFAYTPGTGGSIVVMRVMYMWPIAASPIGFNYSNQPGNKRMLNATTVFKTEYY